MRLTLTIYSLGPGGAQRVASLLASAWAERGHDVTILTLATDDEVFFPLHPEVVVRRVGPVDRSGRAVGKLLDLIRRFSNLRAELRRSRPECVVSFVDQVNVVTGLASIGQRFRLVMAERTDPAMVPIGRMWRTLRDWSYRLADTLVFQTDAATQSISSAVRRRVVVIPNPVVLPEAAARVEESAAPRQILAVGRLAPEKGFDLLIQAFAELHRRFSGWELTILGDGPKRPELEASIAALGLEGRVHLPGAIADVDRYYRTADVFVLPSRFEGFPNALCEAMSWGLPVVATDCHSGPREITRDGKDGVLVPVDDLAAIVGALERLMSDERERRRLGRAARAGIARYAVPVVLRAWDAVLAPGAAGRASAR